MRVSKIGILVKSNLFTRKSHVSRETIYKGYYSAVFFCETFLVIARDKVIKGYKRLWENGIPITFYNPFNPISSLGYSMLEIEISRIITFQYIVSRET